MGLPDKLRAHLRQLLHLDESPQRTALAFAVGMFIAFSPTYGLHTLSAFFCVWAFRLNAVAVLTASFINNPWTVVPILGATFWTGFQLMGMPAGAAFDWDHLTVAALYEQLMPYIVPFFVGGLALSLAGAALSYPLVYALLAKYRIRGRAGAPPPDRLPPDASVR